MLTTFSFSVGFTNIVTIDDIRKAFPYLDCVDKSRWPKEELENATDFPLIEAIVLLGEPVRLGSIPLYNIELGLSSTLC